MREPEVVDLRAVQLGSGVTGAALIHEQHIVRCTHEVASGGHASDSWTTLEEGDGPNPVRVTVVDEGDHELYVLTRDGSVAVER